MCKNAFNFVKNCADAKPTSVIGPSILLASEDEFWPFARTNVLSYRPEFISEYKAGTEYFCQFIILSTDSSLHIYYKRQYDSQALAHLPYAYLRSDDGMVMGLAPPGQPWPENQRWTVLTTLATKYRSSVLLVIKLAIIGLPACSRPVPGPLGVL